MASILEYLQNRLNRLNIFQDSDSKKSVGSANMDFKDYKSYKDYKDGGRFGTVLGTALDVKLEPPTNSNNTPLYDRVHAGLVVKIKKLEAAYSHFKVDSELNRWQNGNLPSHKISEDLKWLIQEAAYWVNKTNSAFHPCVESFTKLWQDAEAKGQVPDQQVLEDLCDSLQKQSIVKAIGVEQQAGMNFHAIAKGRIIDQAIEATASIDGVQGVCLKVGSDLRHIGAGHEIVAISDIRSLAKQDTKQDRSLELEPICKIRINNQAVASSHVFRDGFEVAGKSYGHIIDPRTGSPVSKVQSATVLAPNCSTADVLATSFCVMDPKESLALAKSLAGVEFLVVLSSGEFVLSSGFEQYVV